MLDTWKTTTALPRDYVEKKLEEGRDVILEIEIQGALNVKKMFPDNHAI